MDDQQDAALTVDDSVTDLVWRTDGHVSYLTERDWNVTFNNNRYRSKIVG